MPNGYQKIADKANKMVYEKIHDNNDTTRVVAEKQRDMNGTKWLAYVQDGVRSVGLGEYQGKSGAKQKAMSWMQSNPGGMQMNEGLQFGGMESEDGYSGWM